MTPRARTTWRRNYVLLYALVLLVPMLSCRTGSSRAGEEHGGANRISKIRADAYLYDLRLYRDGKPTSIRLELFRSNEATAINGRAYLGKGALKGRMTPDSLVLFFPTRNEYLSETLNDAAGVSGCNSAISGLRISQFLSALPDSANLPGDVLTEQTDFDKDKPVYELKNRECGWVILLKYDIRGDSFSLKRFEFDSGDRLRVTADRREFKQGKMIPAEKFKVTIPPSAARIHP